MEFYCLSSEFDGELQALEDWEHGLCTVEEGERGELSVVECVQTCVCKVVLSAWVFCVSVGLSAMFVKCHENILFLFTIGVHRFNF